jgi:hypothetical protein
MSNKNYMEKLIAIGRAKHGEKFDSSDLDDRFARYYFSKERIKVKTSELNVFNSDILFGTVGVSTGYKPIFLLMNSIRARGSSILLNKDYEILGVQQVGQRKYCNFHLSNVGINQKLSDESKAIEAGEI